MIHPNLSCHVVWWCLIRLSGRCQHRLRDGRAARDTAAGRECARGSE